MKEEYVLEIRGRTYSHRHYLAQEGFHFVKRSYGRSYWQKKCDNRNLCLMYQTYCKENRLRCNVYESRYLRDHSYRNVYMQRIKGRRKYLFCAYCGIPKRIETITVDHIIPVKKAKYTRMAKWLMKQFSIKDVNDYANLCASCKHCNSRKGTKMGMWLLRGYLGRYQWLWMIRWGVRLCVAGFLLAFLF